MDTRKTITLLVLTLVVGLLMAIINHVGRAEAQDVIANQAISHPQPRVIFYKPTWKCDPCNHWLLNEMPKLPVDCPVLIVKVDTVKDQARTSFPGFRVLIDGEWTEAIDTRFKKNQLTADEIISLTAAR